MTTQSPPIPTLNLEIDHLAGLCPLQGEGSINGYPFYFRARHDAWTFSVALTPGGDAVAVSVWPEEHPRDFHMRRPFGRVGSHDAGYMPENAARRCIRYAARAFVRWMARQGEEGR